LTLDFVSEAEMDCLSSICPNDLISNFVLNSNYPQAHGYNPNYNNIQQHNMHMHYLCNNNHVKYHPMSATNPEPGLVSIKTEMIEDEYNSDLKPNDSAHFEEAEGDGSNLLSRATSMCSSSNNSLSNLSESSQNVQYQQPANKTHANSLNFLLNNIQVMHSYPMVQTHKNFSPLQIVHNNNEQSQQKLFNLSNSKPLETNVKLQSRFFRFLAAKNAFLTSIFWANRQQRFAAKSTELHGFGQ
jgi:hypothetical protein